MEYIRRYFYSLMVDKNKSLFSYPIKFILWILSVIYKFILWIRDTSYRVGIAKPQSPPEAKVISVGNITVGGTGKTPMVIKLTALLKEKGKKVGVLMRGYGQDEYMLLKKILREVPIIRDKDRIRGARVAKEKYQLDTLILDDGFQCRKLRKDFNIILVDSRCPFGNNHLLPRGTLRESISNLKRADVLILTKIAKDASTVSALKEKIKEICGEVEIFETYHKPLYLYDIVDNAKLPLNSLQNREIATLSSVGDPEYFNSILETAGAKIILKFSFLDHHNYTQKEIDNLIACCSKKGLDSIVTTEKDVVKLNGFFKNKTIKLLFLKIEIAFRKDEDRFISRLFRVYNH